MPSYSSSSDSDNERSPSSRLFGRSKPIHATLGGGKVADVLLWREKRASAVLLMGITATWFLFEVVDYKLITLTCHIFMTAMLLVFIWFSGAEIFKWKQPNIPTLIIEEAAFRDTALMFHAKLNKLLSKILYIACGNDFKQFILAIASLWVLSQIGNHISSLNLLFMGLVSMLTLPYLYERYEDDVDRFGQKMNRKMKKMYKKLDSEVLHKIPRGPVKEKKKK